MDFFVQSIVITAEDRSSSVKNVFLVFYQTVGLNVFYSVKPFLYATPPPRTMDYISTCRE